MNTFRRAVHALAITTPFVEPVFLKVLDVSTAHITKEDNVLLGGDTKQECNVMYDSLEYGYLVYLQDREDVDLMTGISDDFKILMHWARESGATHMRLDGDGTKYPQLVIFDW